MVYVESSSTVHVPLASILAMTAPCVSCALKGCRVCSELIDKEGSDWQMRTLVSYGTNRVFT